MKLKALIAALATVLAAGVGAAQREPNAPNGNLPPLLHEAQYAAGTQFIGSVRLGANFDDNLLAARSPQIADTGYYVTPRIGFLHVRKNLQSELQLSSTFLRHQKVNERDLQTRAAGFDLQYQLRRHLLLRLRDRFVKTATPFSEEDASTLDNLIDNPNTAPILPLSQRTSNSAAVELLYRLGPRSLVTITGSTYFQHFHNLARAYSDEALLDNDSRSARGLYSYRLSRRNTVGFMYKYQDLMVDHDFTTRTISQSVFYYHNLALVSGLNLELFGGPDHVLTHTQLVLPLLGGRMLIPVELSHWSWAGGGTLVWENHHTAYRFSFLRAVGGGGGVLSATRRTKFGLEAQHKFGPRWIGFVNGHYDLNKSLPGVITSGRDLEAWYAGIGVTRHVSQHVALHLQYGRAQQARNWHLLDEVANHNRASISLEYEFKHALR